MSFILRAGRSALIVLVAALAISVGTARDAKAQSEPLMGQLMLFAGTFCPRGWAAAEGQLLPVNQNEALFSVLGTVYGGDGRTTFGLPDLRGRAAIHIGTGPGLQPNSLGQRGGAETATMTIAQMPAHNHMVNATGKRGDKNFPGNGYLARPDALNRPSTQEPIAIYRDDDPTKVMNPGMIADSGGGQPMNIRNPYLAMRWCIATTGVFPSRP